MVKKSLLWFYRVTLFTLWTVIFVLAGSVLAMRYLVLPNIDDYRQRIASAVTATVGETVTIGEIDASWKGLNPHLSLHDVQLIDRQQRPALTLIRVEASLSWLSLLLLEPRLSELAVYQPELTIRRETDGQLYVAGIHMGGPARPEFANWLLRQSRIDVVDARMIWQDDLRKAPPLELNQLQLTLINPAWEGLIGHHKFGLRALPAVASSKPIDLRGNFYGRDISRLENWRGTLYARVESADIAVWKQWLDYPLNIVRGTGVAKLWLDIDEGRIAAINSDLALRNVSTRLSADGQPDEQTLQLRELAGRISLKRDTEQDIWQASRLCLLTDTGVDMRDGEFNLQRDRNTRLLSGSLALKSVDLQALHALARHLPLGEAPLNALAAMQPAGKLEQLKLSWTESDGRSLPKAYQLSTAFSDLSMQAYARVPGFDQLSGSLQADQDGGTLELDSTLATLDLPNIMRKPIAADVLNGDIKWRLQAGKTTVLVNDLKLSNSHSSGRINGSFIRTRDAKNSSMDFKANFARADVRSVKHYLPHLVGPVTSNWLEQSLQGGDVRDINVIVKGKTADFPFVDGKPGLFKVSAKLSNGTLQFAESWPKLEGIALDLLFQGRSMLLNASKGQTLGNQVQQARVSIDNLSDHHPVLSVVSHGYGPVSAGVNYVNQSPLVNTVQGFTRTLQTTGDGVLDLELQIPLTDTHTTRVKGSYQISNGSMDSDAMPPITQLQGKLYFTETGIKADNVQASVYGGPAQFNLASQPGGVVHVAARGQINDSGITALTGNGLGQFLSGSADWNADIRVEHAQANIVVNSSLRGIQSRLPAPLNKSADEVMPLQINVLPAESPQQRYDFTLTSAHAQAIAGKLLVHPQQGLVSGDIAINQPAQLPVKDGLSVRAQLQEMDVDAWRKLAPGRDANSGTAANTSQMPLLRHLDISTDTLDVMDKRLHQVTLRADAVNQGWKIALNSREISGDIDWSAPSNGKLTARLKYLSLPPNAPAKLTASPDAASTSAARPTESYPALDIRAERFDLRDKQLGMLELNANPRGEDWHIEKLRISNADSTLTADGDWRSWLRNPQTRLNLNWQIKDLGATLTRYGHPGTIQHGNADISGQLQWAGSPHQFQLANLSGELQLDAKEGQILKVQPGVGRLFSVLTLQNLPRRLTLDFRDVFSSGFTFDTITAKVNIMDGIMRSDNFHMAGPTAVVDMRGSTDLANETQHLYIKVTPFIGDSLSLAALAGGPIVGAAAFVAQKILQDPLNKLAADEYQIIGTWDNPREVEADSPPSVTPASPLTR